jgi:hypothetical protein
MKFSKDEFDVEYIIKETEKQRKLNKEKIKNHFEWKHNKINKYFISLRLSNSFFSKYCKKYFEDYLFVENLDDFIYFKDKNACKAYKKNKAEQITIFGVVMYFPKKIWNSFQKFSSKRKLVIFIMMSFISYLVLAISYLLKNKEKNEV